MPEHLLTSDQHPWMHMHSDQLEHATQTSSSMQKYEVCGEVYSNTMQIDMRKKRK